MDYKMKPEEQLHRIETVFASFFTKHQFKLKSANIQEIIFENGHSKLMFDFDNFGMRFGYMAPPVIIYINKKNGDRYSIESLVEKFHQVDFEVVFDKYWTTQRLDYYVSYLKIITDLVENIISDSTFSWVNDFKQKDGH